MFTEEELQLLLFLVSMFTMKTSKQVLKRRFYHKRTAHLQRLLEVAKSIAEKVRVLPLDVD